MAGVPGPGGEPAAREPLAEHARGGQRRAGLSLLQKSAGDRNPPRAVDWGAAGARPGPGQQ